MIVVGLTGGICMGKSNVSKTFRLNGIPVIDADLLAREVVEPGTIGLSKVIEAFGNQYLKSDGSLDRAKLGAFVFANSEALFILNNILHPLIQLQASIKVKEMQHDNKKIIVYDVPLLFETGNVINCKPIIVVRCTNEQQIARLMKRGTGHGPLTKNEALNIINSQMNIEEKIKKADYVIDTSQDISFSIKQTEEIINNLKLI